MASIFWKNSQWYARLKGEKVPGKWGNSPTNETDRDKAKKFAELAQAAIDKRNARGSDTLRAYVAEWLVKRREAERDWKKERGRLDNHILPILGDLKLADITTAHVADLVHDLRFKKKLANRTARNVYTVLASVMRDAAFAGKVAVSPCRLTETHLGSVTDKDPEWRDGALFTRDEASELISDPRIPFDRRMVYAFGLLAGLRPGEGAALRWRHYDVTSEPLGKLTVATSYSTTNSKTKRTKTESVRHVPVHPTLATLLTEWRRGWAVMMGREPDADDLIVPLPPDVKRTRRTGERFRGWDYTGRRWREVDLPMLGWRPRSVYDTKATFITLAIEDGADETILEQRVTHTKNRRSAFKAYDRGPHWIATCREVAKLSLAPALHPPIQLSSRNVGSGGGDRTANRDSTGDAVIVVLDGEHGRVMTSCDQWLAWAGAKPCSQA
jgi:integrase